MTTSVLRPNGTVSSSGSVTGAASQHAATSDDSDSSYVTHGVIEYSVLNLGTLTLGSDVTKQVRVRVRVQTASGTSSGRGDLTDSSGNILALVVLPATTSAATLSSAYAPVTLSQSDIDGLRVKFSSPQSATGIRTLEAYVDLVTVDQPVVAVDAVSPDPYTASSVVPISWVNTFDADGGGQTRYAIRVYTAAQYGAGGFDPGSSDAYYTSGSTVSSATSADVGPLETGITYRAYVRTAQTVNGARHWSEWAYDQFTVDLTTADVDTVAGVATDASGVITVTVERDTGTEAWDYVEVQRSIDSGVTWSYVRGGAYVDPVDADTFALDDYEVGNGVDVLYRARATRIASGFPITSAWVEASGTVSWSSSDCWLKAPNYPQFSVTFTPGRQSYFRSRRSGVFQPIGARFPVVVSDARSAFSGVLPVLTASAAEQAALMSLLDASDVLLVQYPPSFGIADSYVSVIDDDEVFLSAATLQLARTWSLGTFEVDVPADPAAGV